MMSVEALDGIVAGAAIGVAGNALQRVVEAAADGSLDADQHILLDELVPPACGSRVISGPAAMSTSSAYSERASTPEPA